MTEHITTDFKKIVVENIPLIDVRAPIEFDRGAFSKAVNLPIMNDEERHLVGICYKEKGHEEALNLGNQLVSGEIKQARIDAWELHLKEHPNSLIYCFRGGLRSKLSQEWIYETTGKKVTRLEGGFKAFRNYLIQELDPSNQKSLPILLSGYTGSGKTILLKKLETAIDLEGIAHHRGSSFGNHITPQPSQIDFENNLAYALIQHRHKNYPYMVLENEGTNVGRCFIPKPLVQYFKSGHLVILEIPFEERVHNTLEEYVIQSQREYMSCYGENPGLHLWFDYVSGSLIKVKKRLGGALFKSIMESFELAFKEQMLTGNYSPHEVWITSMLKDYYDPMYHYQRERFENKAIFQGNTDEVYKYLQDFNLKNTL